VVLSAGDLRGRRANGSEEEDITTFDFLANAVSVTREGASERFRPRITEPMPSHMGPEAILGVLDILF